jgi:uncharacterized protein YxjI
MENKFFDGNSYFIDEKVGFFKFENVYNVFNEKGEPLGAVKQKLSVGAKILRILLNKKMLPFKLEIIDNNGQLQATISRGWTFFMSKITIADDSGQTIGFIKQVFKFFKPTFKISDSSGQPIAEISGDWKAWNFAIQDSTGVTIGSITKKWAGAMKEIFTTADKYNVTIEPSFTNKASKIVVLSGAITIDMVLKESK